MTDSNNGRSLAESAIVPPSMKQIAAIYEALSVLAPIDLDKELTEWIRDWYEVAEHTPASEETVGRAVAFMLRDPLREIGTAIRQSVDGVLDRRERCQSDEVRTRIMDLITADPAAV